MSFRKLHHKAKKMKINDPSLVPVRSFIEQIDQRPPAFEQLYIQPPPHKPSLEDTMKQLRDYRHNINKRCDQTKIKLPKHLNLSSEKKQLYLKPRYRGQRIQLVAQGMRQTESTTRDELTKTLRRPLMINKGFVSLHNNQGNTKTPQSPPRQQMYISSCLQMPKHSTLAPPSRQSIIGVGTTPSQMQDTQVSNSIASQNLNCSQHNFIADFVKNFNDTEHSHKKFKKRILPRSYLSSSQNSFVNTTTILDRYREGSNKSGAITKKWAKDDQKFKFSQDLKYDLFSSKNKYMPTNVIPRTNTQMQMYQNKTNQTINRASSNNPTDNQQDNIMDKAKFYNVRQLKTRNELNRHYFTQPGSRMGY